jgi:hypothetical protein
MIKCLRYYPRHSTTVLYRGNVLPKDIGLASR